MGAKINARMGLNPWAAFYGTDANAEIAGDVAMSANEATLVLNALRSNGLNVGDPAVYFLHYWGTGPAVKLATGFKSALDVLGKAPAAVASNQTVIFVCEHGSAKSVVAAAHFNRLAEQNGLPYRAVSRGVNPDAVISDGIKRGMAADGLDAHAWKPTPVNAAALAGASRVVTLDCTLPGPSVDVPHTDWANLPPFGDNYEAGRSDLLARVKKLIAELSATESAQAH